MTNKIVSQINREIENITQLFESYKHLFEEASRKEPDLTEITAIASVIHSFYNGLENIFLIIAKKIDQNPPNGSHWHGELLSKMTQSTSNRPPVISMDNANQLKTYLGFRHFFRHSYSFFLDWEELEKLVSPMKEVWIQVKEDILSFIQKISISTSE